MLHGQFVGQRMVVEEAGEGSLPGSHCLVTNLVEAQGGVRMARDWNSIAFPGSQVHGDAEMSIQFLNGGVQRSRRGTELSLQLLAEERPVSSVEVAVDTRALAAWVPGALHGLQPNRRSGHYPGDQPMCRRESQGNHQ